jgi:molybdopterin converting factor small subunit
LDFLRLPSITIIVGTAQKLEFEGSTIEDLIAHLIKRYGAEVENILVDEENKLNYYILVMVNDELIRGDNREQIQLTEGDSIIFAVLAEDG